MKAILLSAGQGRRLLPLTQELPKCLLPVAPGCSILEHQLRALARCGVSEVTVMVGFGADRVDEAARTSRVGIDVQTRFNPFYTTTDNLITTWLASREMDQDSLLLNGDTLFEPALLRRLLTQATGPATIAVDHKRAYDDDDMKVALDEARCLRAIGKKLEVHPDGEAIGMTLLRGEGVLAFRATLEAAVRHPESLRAWYTSALNQLAASLPIRTVSIDGLWWGEVDCRKDLDAARAEIGRRLHAAPPGAVADSPRRG